MQIQANYPIANTFQIDAKARYFAQISRQSDIVNLRSELKLAALPWLIVGDASNILFTQDFEGLVICNGFKQIKIVQEDENSIWLSVGAGMNWHELVQYTVEQNWWGLENLALIPGTVGASPVQNIGAYGSEARDAIFRVQAIDVTDGSLVEFNNADCEFDYRNSIFKQEYRNRLLVHKVTFHLRKLHAGKPNLVYEPVKQKLEEMNLDLEQLTPQNIFDAVVAIRQKKLPNYQVFGNAGSFFKNPVISKEHFSKLQQENAETYPEIPHHKTLDECYKIPAAWLIEQAGGKGMRHEKAEVSEQHALVLINLGHATGEQIKILAEKVQDLVMQKFSIHLEPEVNII